MSAKLHTSSPHEDIAGFSYWVTIIRETICDSNFIEKWASVCLNLDFVDGLYPYFDSVQLEILALLKFLQERTCHMGQTVSLLSL